ncbi:MAG: preprotein translocase subunit YajC [Kiritimatiellaceae bacterium]|jgi:preprotein translocase subunit YajC|nr:MAG: preprotein translocase subunit YajC [Kiritimatiellaceae bacterium]
MMNELMFVANAAPAAGPEASPFQFPIMMLILFAIMYFLMIRPQKRREKERKQMLESVQSGARVLLTSGIIGQVTNVKENTVVIRIAENTKVEAVRAAISQILEKDEVPTALDAGR